MSWRQREVEESMARLWTCGKRRIRTRRGMGTRIRMGRQGRLGRRCPVAAMKRRNGAMARRRELMFLLYKERH